MSPKWLDRIEGLCMAGLAGFMMWPMGVSSSLLIVLIALRFMRLGTLALPLTRHWWLAFPILIVLLSWFQGGFAEDGLREIRLLPILPAAVIVFYKNPMNGLFLRSFIGLSAIQATIVLIYLSILGPFDSEIVGYAIRETIAAKFHVHPTYLGGAWFLAALVSLLAPPSVGKWLKALVLVLLCLGGVLAGGKMALVIFVVAALVFAIRNIKQPLMRVAVPAVSILSLALAITFVPSLNQRFEEVWNVRTTFQEGDMLNATELRLGIWQCSIEGIKANAKGGVGSGNTRATLETCFAKFEQIEFFDGEYNTHNQFLHFALMAGIPGLFLWLFYLFCLGRSAWKQQKEMLAFVLFYLSSLMLTENYLNRQLGMMLFCFFIVIAFSVPDKPRGSAPPSDSM